MGDCKGFALGAYLIFNVAAMLWQVIFTNKDIVLMYDIRNTKNTIAKCVIEMKQP